MTFRLLRNASHSYRLTALPAVVHYTLTLLGAPRPAPLRFNYTLTRDPTKAGTINLSERRDGEEKKQKEKKKTSSPLVANVIDLKQTIQFQWSQELDL